jgi:hypothetical protein
MIESVVFLLCVYALWPLYVFAMAIERAHKEKTVSLTAWALAIPIIIWAVVLDVLLNLFVFSILLFEFPKKGEWTFSQRLNRLVKCDNWRRPVARWVAASLLDPYSHDGKPHIK